MATFYTYKMIRHFAASGSGQGGNIANDNFVKLAGQFSGTSRGYAAMGNPSRTGYVFPARGAIFADGTGFVAAKSGSREYKHWYGNYVGNGTGLPRAVFGNSQAASYWTGSSYASNGATQASIAGWLPICSLPPYGPFAVSVRVTAWQGRSNFAAAEVVIYGVNASVKKVEKISSYAQGLSTSTPGAIIVTSPGSYAQRGNFCFTLRSNTIFATYACGNTMRLFASAIPNAPWQRSTSYI